MKAILVAAGMGRRLAPYTDDRPKCMVEVNGKTLLARQVEAYRDAGITDVVVVRGYLGERLAELAPPGLRFVDNPRYRENNILASLMCAASEMDGGFYFSYTDIVFRREVVRALAATAEAVDYALVVDRKWRDAYGGRDLHPVSEAEVARVEGGRVLAVGKRKVPADQAHGEFIGLARFSARAADRMRAEYRRLAGALGPDAPFGDAARFEGAYVTDLLNHLIAAGEAMTAVDIDGGWREIDTTQDLERARAIVDW